MDKLFSFCLSFASELLIDLDYKIAVVEPLDQSIIQQVVNEQQLN